MLTISMCPRSMKLHVGLLHFGLIHVKRPASEFPYMKMCQEQTLESCNRGSYPCIIVEIEAVLSSLFNTVIKKGEHNGRFFGTVCRLWLGNPEQRIFMRVSLSEPLLAKRAVFATRAPTAPRAKFLLEDKQRLHRRGCDLTITVEYTASK